MGDGYQPGGDESGCDCGRHPRPDGGPAASGPSGSGVDGRRDDTGGTEHSDGGAREGGPRASTGSATGPAWAGSGPATHPAEGSIVDVTGTEAAADSDDPASPVLDGRDAGAVRSTLAARASGYTGEDWDPEAGGPGSAILDLFAGMAADVLERLDQMPEKHRRAFVDALGFDQRPPQSARVPVTLSVSEGADGGVTVPPGTRVLAEPASPDAEEQVFEFEAGFEATPASIDRLVAVDPDVDHVATVPPRPAEAADLFGDRNDQTHRLFLGHPELLGLSEGSKVELAVETAAPTEWFYGLDWEYFGPHRDEPDADPTWHALETPTGAPSHGDPRGSLPAGEQALEPERVRSLLADRGYRLLETSEAELERWLTKQALHGGPVASYARRVTGLSPSGPSTSTDGPPADRNLEFVVPGEPEETEVDGVESRWVRCSIPENVAPAVRKRLFAMRLAGVEIGGGQEAHPPDAMLANDVPLSVPKKGEDDEDRKVFPFGRTPRERDAFYLADEEAFTKPGQSVTITFRDEGGTAGEPPLVSWEYWNGDGWSVLSLSEGSDRTFGESPSTVTFDVPSDLASTEVSGHEGHWIRARLIDGGYGEVQDFAEVECEDVTSGVWRLIDAVDPPAFLEVEVAYDEGNPAGAPASAISENNLSRAHHESASGITPFAGPQDDEQALYFGFDGRLDQGPYQSFLSLVDVTYPPSFSPRVRWEALTAEGWQPLSVRDGTEGLRETGVVRFTLPAETVPTRRFGAGLHWVRARIRAPGGFVLEPYAAAEPGESDESDDRRCSTPLATSPPGSGPHRPRPELSLALANTGTARNGRTVSAERLGSSDGTPDQTFTVGSPPAREPELWVDELATLSEGAWAALQAAADVPVRAEGPANDLDAFWVRWERVDDLLASGPGDRHYAYDPVTGRVAFGDGTRGKIPPTGRENLRIGYHTGGGTAGNVGANAVTGLEGSIAFVEGATNELPADGGADTEAPPSVVDRAGRALRDRDRAVAPADYERVALEAARTVERAHCLPALDARGNYSPGWVTVLVVPRTRSRKPVPSATLTERVTGGVLDRAPASLGGAAPDGRLVVRGPTYVEASVTATVAAGDVSSLATLEQSAEESLGEFFHPLSGDEDGSGWPFGELPCASDCTALLERLDGVDHVVDLAVEFRPEEGGDRRTVRMGEDSPDVEPDVLVYAGAQDVRAEGGP